MSERIGVRTHVDYFELFSLLPFLFFCLFGYSIFIEWKFLVIVKILR